MRYPSDFSLIIAIVVLYASPTLAISVTNPKCLDFPVPWRHHERTHVPCPIVSPSTDSSHLHKREVFDTSNQLTFDGSDLFQVNFSCNSTAALCSKAAKAFATAGTIISGVLLFNTPVTVNASFLHFCPNVPIECSIETPSYTLLGGTYPSRMIPIIDTDGIGRFYPQSLIKQFGYTSHPQYSSYDITSMFNADADFWFEDDGVPINSNQSDFLFVIIHEFMHGLGFTSSWSDYFNDNATALTPDITPLDTGDNSDYPTDTTPFTFQGFFEYAFDKYMVVLPSNYASVPVSSYFPMSNFTRQLNTFYNGSAKFKTFDSFLSAFPASAQYKIALEIFSLYAINPLSLAILPPNATSPSDMMILETSLNPFIPGSSISHCSESLYEDTTDFLMKYLQQPGVSLAMIMQNVTGNTIEGGGPIGPLLLSVLETMGYTIRGREQPSGPPLILVNTASSKSRWQNIGIVIGMAMAVLLIV